MDPSTLVRINYGDIPGLDGIMGFGRATLMLALAITMCLELYRLIVSGRADFITPILKVGGALLLLSCLLPLGEFLSGSLQAMSKELLKEDVYKLAGDAWAAAFSGVSGPIDFIKNLFSQVTWLSLLTYFALVAIIVIKVVVIDIVFPVLLAVTVVMGSLSIPLGLFPGSRTIGGWAKNVVEVSLWPIIFQILTTMLFATFSGNLKDMSVGTMEDLRKLYNVNAAFEGGNVFDQIEAMDENNMTVSDVRAMQSKLRQNIDPAELASLQSTSEAIARKYVRFLAVAVAFGIMCLMTPLIARKVVHSEAAGYLGSMAVGAITGRMQAAGGWAWHRLNQRRSGNSGGGDGGGSGGGLDVMKVPVTALEDGGRSPAECIDERKPQKAA